MGKKDKAHRAKVKRRNERLKQEERIIENLQRKIYEEAKARYEAQQSGMTQDTFQLKIN